MNYVTIFFSSWPALQQQTAISSLKQDLQKHSLRGIEGSSQSDLCLISATSDCNTCVFLMIRSFSIVGSITYRRFPQLLQKKIIVLNSLDALTGVQSPLQSLQNRKPLKFSTQLLSIILASFQNRITPTFLFVRLVHFAPFY